MGRCRQVKHPILINSTPFDEKKFMKSQSLAIVESPLQLMCAYEVLQNDPSAERSYILRLSGNIRNDQQMIETARFLEISYRSILVRPKRVAIDTILGLYFIFGLFLDARDTVYYGSYYSRFIKVIKYFVRAESVFFLDDGVATFLAQNDMSKKKKVQNIATFLPVTPLAGQNVIRHEFFNVRNRIGSEKRIKANIFIGQKMIETGILRKEHYLSCIKKAVQLSGERIIYIPHRGECSETLKSIEQIEGLAIMETTLPIELFFLASKYDPVFIYSVLSTAFFSLSLMFPDAQIVSLKHQSLHLSKVPHMKEIENGLKKIRNYQSVGL